MTDLITAAKSKLTSRKLWAAVAAAALAALADQLGLDAQAVDQVVQLASVYIGGQGVVDFAAAWKAETATEAE